jgi:hypothetical protein
VAEKLGYEREVKCCDDYLLKDQMLISDYWTGVVGFWSSSILSSMVLLETEMSLLYFLNRFLNRC